METALPQKCATVKKATRKSTGFVSQSVQGKIEKLLRNITQFTLKTIFYKFTEDA